MLIAPLNVGMLLSQYLSSLCAGNLGTESGGGLIIPWCNMEYVQNLCNTVAVLGSYMQSYLPYKEASAKFCCKDTSNSCTLQRQGGSVIYSTKCRLSLW